MLTIWPAILVYDYCLTFVAEVERCWTMRRLTWALAFFYLNRYLMLLGYIPLMLEFFWSTSNPNKTEVSVLLLKSPGRDARREGTDGHSPRCWYSSARKCPLHNLIIFFVQLSPLAIVSRISNHHHSGGRCLSAHCFPNPLRQCWFIFFSIQVC